MTVIYFTRHGRPAYGHNEQLTREADDPNWRSQQKYPDDPDLTDVGVKQAVALAEALQGKGVSVVYSSPFSRTMSTANETSKLLKVPLRVEWGTCEEIRERWYVRGFPGTEYELLSPADRKEKFPFLDPTYESWYKVKFPETKPDLHERTAATIKHIVEVHLTSPYASGIPLIVSHGSVTKGMITGLTGEDVDIPRPDYCSLSIVDGDMASGLWTMPLLNDQTHLASLLDGYADE